MRKIGIGLLLLASFIFQQASADELEIKGIAMGSTAEEFLKSYPHHRSGWSTPANGGTCDDGRVGMHRCTYSGHPPESPDFTIAGVNTRPTFIYQDNKLVEIYADFYAPETSFEALIGAFTKKYSKPTNLSPLMEQNMMGATLQNIVAIWELSSGNITLIKYGDINHSHLEIVSKSFADQQKSAAANKSKSAEKDL